MIVKNLRESREMLDIKQKDVAKIFNVNFSTVSGWETGKDTIPLKRLIDYKLSNFWGSVQCVNSLLYIYIYIFNK